MANTMPCDMGCGLVAHFLVGDLETGEQTAFCLADFARAGLEVAKVQLPRDEILTALAVTEAAAPDGGPPATGTDTAPKRARAKKPKPAPGPEATQALAPEPAAAPND